MQYGISGIKKNKEVIKGRMTANRIEPIKLALITLTVFLMSRVVVYISKGDVVGIAPFGIAFLAIIAKSKDETKIAFSAVGAVLGYLSINGTIENSYIYIVTSLLVLISKFILSNRMIKEKYILGIFFSVSFISELLFEKHDVATAITMSAILTLVIVPIYHLIKYGIECIENYNTNYYFNVEELISIGVVGCLVIAGIGNISIADISLRNLIAISFIIIVGYIGGATGGGAIGITMGLVIGVSNGKIIESIGFYSLLGLVGGLFKETGKIFSVLATCIVYIILVVYTNGTIDRSIIEVLGGCLVFLMIPKKILENIDNEINNDSKMDYLNEIHMNQIKEEFTERVEGLSEMLESISTSVGSLSTNNALMYKDRSTAIINNLADRICSNCENSNKCWKNKFNQTYNSFEKIIRGREENYRVFPSELEKTCLKKYEILKEVDNLLLSIKAEALNKEKLEEGRQMIAEHIGVMSKNIQKMIRDFKSDIKMNIDLECSVRRELNRNSVKYNDVFCYTDKEGKIKIKIKMENCSGCNYCKKSVLPIINSLVKQPMMIGSEGCRINPNNKDCTAIIKEMPRYNVDSYVGISVKEGEEYTGDTYSFGKVSGGKYLTVISDGMGSGPEASKESQMTVDLMENFLNCGFEVESALNTINSIMTMKFDEDEKFATLDMNKIDLYTGAISFVKIGATSSFIKRGREIIKISSNMPPFGLVDKIEIEPVDKRVKNGDIIVTLSDGVLDVDKDKVGDTEWLENFLINSKNNPKGLAIDIIEESKRLNKGSIKDDMTVVVSKVRSLY